MNAKTSANMNRMFRMISWFRQEYSASLTLSLIILGAWEGSIILFGIPSAILPAPSLIIQTFISNVDHFAHHTYATFQAIMVGFIVGSIIGIFCGVAVFYVKFIRLAVYPLLTMISITPKLAFAPLLVIWFGAGMVSKVVLAILVVFFPTLVNTYAGLTDIDDDLLRLNQVYSAKEWFVFRHIRIPNALPYLISGLKLGIVFSVIGVIVAEYIASSEGIGYLIVSNSTYGRTDESFAALLSIVALVLALYKLAGYLEDRLLFWQN